ncbi:MAG: FMN-binding protein [Eggerthellaceae bacterium]|nr:FMN-binding protein [Eggerthellaceae bacterium]
MKFFYVIKHVGSIVVGKNPLWFSIPVLVTFVLISITMRAYVPLAFDPQTFAAEKKAFAAEDLKTIDAEEIAAANKKPSTPEVLQQAGEVGNLADGTWTGFASCGTGNGDGWKPYYVGLTIVVKDGKVIRVSNAHGASSNNQGGPYLSWDAAENQAYLNRAINGVVPQINAALSQGKTLQGVDTVSGATYSSVAIYNAYVNALQQSSAAAGSTTEVKEVIEEHEKSVISSKEVSAPSVGALADGTYLAWAAAGIDAYGNMRDECINDEWSPYYVRVQISISDGKIVSIDEISASSSGEPGSGLLSYNEAENRAYLDWATFGRTRQGVYYPGVKEQLDSYVAQGKVPTSIDTVSGATVTSEAIFEALYGALKKSAALAGSVIDMPNHSDDEANANTGGSNTGGKDDSSSSQGQNGNQDTNAPDDEKKDTQDSSGGSEDIQQPTGLYAGNFPDGMYSGYAFCLDGDAPNAWAPYYVIVEISASGGRITSVTNIYGDASGIIDPSYIYDAHENGTYLSKAANGGRSGGLKKKLQNALDAGIDASSIDTVSSATWSSYAIRDAFEMAVANAKASSVD